MAKQEKSKEKEIIISGKNAVLGRLAAFAAKKALEGNKIIILDCNNVIISGNEEDILKTYKHKVERGRGSLKGPYFPRTPELITRRTVRGMLPWSKKRGRDAFKRVICYEDVPAEYAGKEKLSLESLNIKKFVTVKRMCEIL